MQASQCTRQEDLVRVIGILTGTLVLLHRLKTFYRGSRVDDLIASRMASLRVALSLLIRGEVPDDPQVPEEPQEELSENVEEESPWDPSSRMAQVNCHRCKALLVEVMKRAAHDWVLYRTSSKLDKKQLALDAYMWLFREEPGTEGWREREDSGFTITSFLAICEALDLDPDTVRGHIRQLSVPAILHVGRPAETRRSKKSKRLKEGVVQHEVVEVSLDALDQSDTVYLSQYEAHYATTTLGGT